MFQNLTNGKQYIGSSNNLTKRFYEYFNQNSLLRNKSMTICCALLKHGHSNFAITILEYCSPDKCLIREKHYWDILIPKYNIAQDPVAPMSGRTHSDDTKIIMSDASKGEKNPMFGKNHSDKTRENISLSMPNNIKIEVTDIKNNTTISYDSIRAAARALNLPNHNTIIKYIRRNQQKPYKGQYTFKKV